MGCLGITEKKAVSCKMNPSLPLAGPGKACSVSRTMAKILAAMSGGVDSSVAAAVLLEQGHDVVAAYMKNWINEENILGDCPWQQDIEDARAVSDKLKAAIEGGKNVSANLAARARIRDLLGDRTGARDDLMAAANLQPENAALRTAATELAASANRPAARRGGKLAVPQGP